MRARIGRELDNEIVIHDVLASRHHAVMVPTPKGAEIRDAGSINGTFVNGKRVDSTLLSDGDVVTIGNVDLVFTGGTLVRRQEVATRTGGLEVRDVDFAINGKNLLEMKAEEAACEGLFLAFQYPVEIPGISNAYFLRSALNAIRKYRGEDEMDAMDFLPLMREKLKLLNMDEKLMNRSVNESFSGGEKKRNEILQMAVLQPKLAILDETDSGLDIDALRIVAQGVNAMRSPDRGFLVITHYQRLLDYIATDFVHVLVDGKIVRSGGPELALELEDKGYGSAEADAQAALQL